MNDLRNRTSTYQPEGSTMNPILVAVVFSIIGFAIGISTLFQ